MLLADRRPRPSPWSLVAAIAPPLLATGCFVADIPDGVPILCAQAGDCPDGLRCSAELQRCVIVDGDPPALDVARLDPLVLKSGQLTLDIRTSEPIAAVSGHVDGLDVAFVVLGVSGHDATLRAEVPAGLPGGRHDVIVEVVDEHGDRAVLRAGTIELDTEPPALAASATLQPAFARADSTPEVRFTLTEAAAAPPVVTYGNVAFAVTADDDAGRSFRATLALDDVEEDGPGNVFIDAVDRAGNRAERLLAGLLVIDRRAPVAAIGAHPPVAREQGVQFVVDADEDVVDADARLLLQDEQGSAVVPLASRQDRRFVFEGTAPPRDGVFAVVVAGLFDQAGNEATSLAQPTLVVRGCGRGLHDDGVGECVASGCAAGFHDGGDGITCLADGAPLSCIDGFHDGGDGATCLEQGRCMPGLRDGGDGTCVPLSACAVGFHDGGNGACLADGPALSCSLGFHDGGRGDCLPLGSCSGGFHDGGDGECVVMGQCSAGFHDGGDGGECVARGVCLPGFHDGGDGTCVAAGVCVDGFRDGGNGACLASDALDLFGNLACSPGFHDDGLGLCVTLDRCAAGFHDGGDGICVAVGTCSANHHDGGSGRCVELDVCLRGFHDGGDGSCVADGTCSDGFHDGGANQCMPVGECFAGFHDGGDGSCLPSGLCIPGLVLAGDVNGGGACYLAQPEVAFASRVCDNEAVGFLAPNGQVNQLQLLNRASNNALYFCRVGPPDDIESRAFFSCFPSRVPRVVGATSNLKPFLDQQPGDVVVQIEVQHAGRVQRTELPYVVDPSLDGVSCCSPPSPDEVRRVAALPGGSGFERLDVHRPSLRFKVFGDTDDVLIHSLRRRFSFDPQNNVVVVTRSYPSTTRLAEGATLSAACATTLIASSDSAVERPEYTCFAPVERSVSGDAGRITSSTCKLTSDGGRDLTFTFQGLDTPAPVVTQRQCPGGPLPVIRYNEAPVDCLAYAFDSDGNGACLVEGPGGGLRVAARYGVVDDLALGLRVISRRSYNGHPFAAADDDGPRDDSVAAPELR
jgi:hypothetical protein